MKPKRLAILTVMAGLCGTLATGGARAACLDDAAAEAFRAHALRTELMVGALSCGQGASYDALIARHRGELVAQSRVLADALAPGADGAAAVDAVLTRLANDISRRSVAEGGAACTRWAALFQAAAVAEDATFAGLADQTAQNSQLWQIPDVAVLTGLARCNG